MQIKSVAYFDFLRKTNIFNRSKIEKKKETEGKKEVLTIKELTNELGIAREGVITSYNAEENPDDLGPETYIEMQRNDGEIQAIVRVLTLPIVSTSIHILPAENDKGESDFIKTVFLSPPSLGGMTTPLPFIVADMTRAIFEGFRLYEKVARIIEDGEYKGKVGWRKLAPRDAQTILLRADKHGGFEGAHQEATFGGENIEVDIPPEQCMLFTFQKEKHWLYGESILKTAFYHYDKKHKLYYIAHKKAEIEALGLKILKINQTLTSAERTAAEETVDTIGINSRITLPPGIELEVQRGGDGYDPLPLIEHHNCVDEETELLSRKGWLKWNELKKNEEIFTLNKETGKSEWKKVEDIFKRSVKNKELISIKRKNGSFSALTTKDHKWLVSTPWSKFKYYWKTSEELKNAYRIPRAVKNGELPKEKFYSDEIVELIAWIMTEGHFCKSGGINITQNLGPKADRIRKLLSKTNLRWSQWHPQKNKDREKFHTTFHIFKSSAFKLRKLAPDRTPLLEFLLKLTEKQLGLFVETSLDGDGTRVNNGKRTFYQKSLKRIGIFEIACALLGQATNTRFIDNHGRDLWAVELLQVPHLQIRRTERKLKKYTGVIWCPHTENGTFLAKREGGVYWTGNTQMARSALTQALDQVKYAYPYGRGTPSSQYLILTIESIMKQMEATLNTFAVAPLIDFNYGTKAYPQIRFERISDISKTFLREVFDRIMRAGTQLPDGFVEEVISETAKELKLEWASGEETEEEEKNVEAFKSFEEGKLKKSNQLNIEAPRTPKAFKRKLLGIKSHSGFEKKCYELGEEFALCQEKKK